ncbi:Fur family transcriptional regulator [Galbibacter pacificus]|uniref:Ferric uptake regulation protein n=1 Tax=Galbibacter pacificus TaxID=2996052 RepID=A0ABT6FUZ6_9FLAO|nr:transcriptional repressor [Galbibacter pacificus]MDG3583440.1 transcriptional repressor [Galbibacter pacificus]MDG3587083.1 transcriptional repressor [Galbibacter pacificus]
MEKKQLRRLDTMVKNKRNTKAKELILETIKNASTAVNKDIIQEEIGNVIDRATIYRVLNSFYDDGIVHKILGDDGKQYYAYCINCGEKKHLHSHFHFRCLNCGKVECLPNEIDVKLPKGYQSVNFNGFISGYCNQCSKDE